MYKLFSSPKTLFIVLGVAGLLTWLAEHKQAQAQFRRASVNVNVGGFGRSFGVGNRFFNPGFGFGRARFFAPQFFRPRFFAAPVFAPNYFYGGAAQRQFFFNQGYAVQQAPIVLRQRTYIQSAPQYANQFFAPGCGVQTQAPAFVPQYQQQFFAPGCGVQAQQFAAPGCYN